MTILIAPDKFKGSLTAEQVCAAIESGIRKVSDSIKVVSVPLADGGEGTADLLTRFSNGTIVTAQALDPLLRPIDVTYGMSSGRDTAFIEMAKVSGLQLLKPDERNPMNTTTFGTGQLIKDATSRGASKIILGIGGSATNDAGCGMAAALGYSFFSGSGPALQPVGRNLVSIRSIQEGAAPPFPKGTSFTVLCDVDNPLYGEKGAAFVFGPQKGASESDVQLLDEGLRNFEKVVRHDLGLGTNFPGAGAAGGLGAGAKVFLNATLSPGFEFISTFVRLEDQINSADLVITGEGKIDTQTLSGKVVKGVAQLARRYGKRCIAFAGVCELPAESLRDIHIEKIITLRDAATNERQAMKSAFQIIERKSFEFINDWISTS